MNISEELELQHYLSRLESLRASAVSEFDFKGPFPDEIYARTLRSTSNMLDAFHAMNVIIAKDLRASEGEAEILKFTANERAQLCARISHLFQGQLARNSSIVYAYGIYSFSFFYEDRIPHERCTTQHRACARQTSGENLQIPCQQQTCPA